jgi:hypothetical protein
MSPKITIKELSMGDEKDIEYILKHSTNGTIFHTYEWNKLVSDEFKIPHRTLIAKENGKPLGVFTFFIVKNKLFTRIESPLIKYGEIPYGGPVIIDGEKEEIIDKLVREVTGNLVEYWQIYTPPFYPIDIVKKIGFKCMKLFTPIVKLGMTEKELWDRIDSKRRNLIRKATSNKLQVVTFTANAGCSTSSGFVDSYYHMLLEVFKGHRKVPPPKSYYQRILQELTPYGWVKALLALDKGKPIAGAIFLCFKDTVYYWSGASFSEYRYLSANDLIQWELIKWANQNNYKYYDLTRVEPEGLPGVAHFKLGYGGELIPIYIAIRRTLLGQISRVMGLASRLSCHHTRT